METEDFNTAFSVFSPRRMNQLLTEASRMTPDGARIAGIIAEYNPYHNGHLYQMRKARSTTGAPLVHRAAQRVFCAARGTCSLQHCGESRGGAPLRGGRGI